MTDQFINKLGAYLDGELNQRGNDQIEAHLKTCAACQAELAELQLLSKQLQEASQPESIPALDFKNQVMLQLPRRDGNPDQKDANISIFYWVPVVILISWIFLQIVFWFSGETILAGIMPQQMLWFDIYQSIFDGSPIFGNLFLLNQIDVYFFNFVLQLLFQAGIGILYGAILYLLLRNQSKGNVFVNGNQ